LSPFRPGIASAPILAIALIWTAPAARAQSIYVDLSLGIGTAPSSSFGAAAGTPGHWNDMPNSSTHAMLDVLGQPTSVVVTAGPVCDSGHEDFPTTSGDEAALLDDWAYADCYEGQLQIEVTGLRAGRYQLYLYPLGNGGGLHHFAIAPPAGGSVEGGAQGTTLGLGPFNGSFATWHVPVRVLDVPTDGSSFKLHGGGTGLAGLQLVRLADAATFCGGDQGWCPCGIGAAGAGCPSSFSSSGASLAGAGSMSVSNDTFQLTASSTSNSVVTFFQGTSAQSLGLGSLLGDGLRCAGGSVIRLAAVQAVGGVAQYPTGSAPAVSVRGMLPPVGGFRTYQVAYRNSIDYCTTSTFNSTNGVAVEWLP
jgi:hypothetical protein